MVVFRTIRRNDRIVFRRQSRMSDKRNLLGNLGSLYGMNRLRR